MSHFGNGQFDDAEGAIERRIQEELRARQQANSAASRLTGALAGHTGFSGAADRAFMNSLIAAESAASSASSPYYAQRAAAAAASSHSPFARGPYTALGQQAAASAYGVGHSNDAVAASIYARQRAQYGYGNAAAAANAERAYYGVPGPGHDLYAQHFGRTQDQLSLIDRAAAYNAQQRQAEQANAALLGQAASPSSSSSVAYMQKPPSTKISSPRSAPRQPAPVSTSSSSTPASASPNRGRPRKTLTPIRPPSSDKTQSSEGGTEEGDDSQKWYSGCVPLGLEDDKYWLSELQVFLRAHFAEAFGATEEDIAAPMHGRNKPIALGQVGIRCMHCKREFLHL